MAQRIEEVMSRHLQSVHKDATLHEVAQLMRDHQIGDVLVTTDDNKLCGIITDRDIVIRAIADGEDPDQIRAGDICTDQIVTIEPSASLDDAVQLMRERAIRRVPVVRDEVPVGIVSIGDLALEKDRHSALADISAAPPSH